MAIRGPFPGVDQATQSALRRGVILVFVPGFIFVFGLIALVMPPRPPVSTLYGCYRSGTSPLVKVSAGMIAAEDEGIEPIKMSVGPGKEGYIIYADTGFSFWTDQQGKMHAVKDHSLGELIPVFISQSQPPAIGLISDGGAVKIPKINCPT